ncbi:tRNA (guanine(26)-N(2))-dimethyltransferase [Ostreococcus tauri]|uniref:tRNA (guanine(26)-N(2))-dimethyltransferase n=1 Tax=Ostreococcus tauri TaxID=70448 RepID=Q00YF6_OSTTA|nr:tRNA (guanine(26)-N(2))-dimethyltransferase [Ostreococcus tauri]CAL55953.1 tRNA (guanine(26)-N(2))-dimethyltransferase [Ostreococcus tauri]|eukprot:XP_003082150.1 tRNA (guanine(26)-N(2))-dimethyltransferase [Ostreococcus tauri]
MRTCARGQRARARLWSRPRFARLGVVDPRPRRDGRPHGRTTARDAVVRERGVDIVVDESTFYRPESAQARDLGALLARSHGRALERGLDACDGTCASGARFARMAACGVNLRSVTCVDVSADVRDALNANLDAHVRSRGVETSCAFDDSQRVFARKWLAGELYDYVDVDGFGSANFADSALRIVRHGGYFYATSTDGRALCGQNAERCATAFGNSIVSPSRPSVNETAVRVFIGDVVRRGSALKLRVTPVFSLFHPHGPVFRVMFRVDKRTELSGYDAFGKDSKHIGFVGYCDACGNTEVIQRPLVDIFGHNKLSVDDSRARCSLCAKREPSTVDRSSQLAISGPMWIGSLHERETVIAMRSEAEDLGWLEDKSAARGQLSLHDLLHVFEEESDIQLSKVSHYFRTDELGRKGRARRVPPRDALLDALRARGFAATRSSFDARGVKTNASIDDVIECANRACVDDDFICIV